MTNSDLVKTGLQEGARMVRARWGLVVILYAFTLILGMLIAVPIYLGVVKHVGPTGFGADLIESFDTLLWREIVIKLTDTLTGFGIQLILVLPLYWIWKTVAHMGVIYALHNGAIFSFWRGVGAYALKGLVISLIFLLPKAIWLVLSMIIAGVTRSFFPGEVGVFWCIAILMPFLILAGTAMLDLFQRYACMAVIIRHDSIGKALSAGFSWPFKYGAASYLYTIWYMIALFVIVISFMLNAQLHVGVSAILLGFFIQQVSLFTRAGVSVAWVGSEVSLFERTHIHELPLIADVDPGQAPEGLSYT